MSFFGNLKGGGINGPDVVINGDGGSLLPTSSSGMRFSSAQINQQNKLLSGVTAYDYGQGSVSDDISHQVTPHKIQKIVPQFRLPSSRVDAANDDLTVTHSVCDGDLAFTIRIVHGMAARVNNYSYFEKQNITRAVDPIINLATVNYIIRGLQTDMGSNSDNWAAFLLSTGWPIDTDGYTLEDFRYGDNQHRNISMFIQDYIRPLGVVIGSDMQGGQHQGGGGPVDFPVDFVVTILVDGLCDNMLNLWRRTEIRAGCDLLLALVGVQMTTDTHKPGDRDGKTFKEHARDVGPLEYQVFENGGIRKGSYVLPTESTKYVLNHWAQNQLVRDFTKMPRLLFELVPTTSVEIDEAYFLGDDSRNRGLWHIARSQTHIRVSEKAQRAQKQTFRDDSANLGGGALLQVTVAPVWKHAARSKSYGVNFLPRVTHVLPTIHVNAQMVAGTTSAVGAMSKPSTSAYPVDTPLYIQSSVARRVAGAPATVNVASSTAVKRTADSAMVGTSEDISTAQTNKRAATVVPRSKKSVMESESQVSAGMHMEIDAPMVAAAVATPKVYARSVVTGTGVAGVAGVARLFQLRRSPVRNVAMKCSDSRPRDILRNRIRSEGECVCS